MTTVHECQNLHRFAAMGGIYGNVPALQACLQDAREQQCESLLFLGDAIGFCGHSDEVIDLIRQHFDTLIAGNHELEAAAGSNACGCGYASPEDERLSSIAAQRSLIDLSQSNREWLKTLPHDAIINTAAGRILLCHGSLDRINEFLFESALDEQRLLGWLEQYEAVGFICTHSGLPWIRHLKDGQFAANCGVVGKPDNDGDPAVHYLIVTLTAGSVEDIVIQRVEYDYLDWSNTLEREGVDSMFIEPLRTGFWTYGVASLA
jgi:diadenosine tetraphosphatase ApaH/serine/threonine PP2A family protein phosphatase